MVNHGPDIDALTNDVRNKSWQISDIHEGIKEAAAGEFAGFIAKDNSTGPTTFVLELQVAVTKLQVHPGMGRAGRLPGTRELVMHKKYIAIHRVRGDDVEILRLHHAARNL